MSLKKEVGMSLKTFWALVLTLLPHFCIIFKAIPSASPKLLNLNQDHCQKIYFSGQIFIR